MKSGEIKITDTKSVNEIEKWFKETLSSIREEKCKTYMVKLSKKEREEIMQLPPGVYEVKRKNKSELIGIQDKNGVKELYRGLYPLSIDFNKDSNTELRKYNCIVYEELTIGEILKFEVVGENKI